MVVILLFELIRSGLHVVFASIHFHSAIASLELRSIRFKTLLRILLIFEDDVSGLAVVRDGAYITLMNFSENLKLLNQIFFSHSHRQILKVYLDAVPLKQNPFNDSSLSYDYAGLPRYRVDNNFFQRLLFP